MIDWLAPYIYVVGMVGSVLLVGATTLAAGVAPADTERPAHLALTAALCTWATTAFIIAEPLPVAWLHALSLSAWVLLSLLCVALVWFCRRVQPPEPPTPPAEPHVYPRINGQWRTPSDTQTIEADALRRTYRRRA